MPLSFHWVHSGFRPCVILPPAFRFVSSFFIFDLPGSAISDVILPCPFRFISARAAFPLQLPFFIFCIISVIAWASIIRLPPDALPYALAAAPLFRHWDATTRALRGARFHAVPQHGRQHAVCPLHAIYADFRLTRRDCFLPDMRDCASAIIRADRRLPAAPFFPPLARPTFDDAIDFSAPLCPPASIFFAIFRSYSPSFRLPFHSHIYILLFPLLVEFHILRSMRSLDAWPVVSDTARLMPQTLFPLLATDIFRCFPAPQPIAQPTELIRPIIARPSSDAHCLPDVRPRSFAWLPATLICHFQPRAYRDDFRHCVICRCIAHAWCHYAFFHYISPFHYFRHFIIFAAHYCAIIP